jgi:hypothetical protein
MTKLSLTNLEEISVRAAVPRYGREQFLPGIAHIAAGNFIARI